jgi:CheY-like chemotaxis protein
MAACHGVNTPLTFMVIKSKDSAAEMPDKPILIADDFPDDVDLFKIALQQAGVLNPVYVVHDGRDAIEYFEGRGTFIDRARYPLPEVLFLDLKMPGMDGFQVLEWLKGKPEFEGMLVVVLSGAGEAQAINRAYQLRADTFVAKPFRRDDIDSLIKHHEGHWQLRPKIYTD